MMVASTTVTGKMMYVTEKAYSNIPTVDKYDGDWADDMQHGKGTYFFHTGDRYEGSYLLGERTGEGIYYHANGINM